MVYIAQSEITWQELALKGFNIINQTPQEWAQGKLEIMGIILGILILALILICCTNKKETIIIIKEKDHQTNDTHNEQK